MSAPKSLKAILSEDDFNRTLPHTKISEQSQDISKGVLVHGMQLKHFTEKYGISYSAVHQTCSRFFVSFIKMRNLRTQNLLPKGLVLTTVITSETRVPQIKKWEEDDIKRYCPEGLDKEAIVRTHYGKE